MKQALSLGIFGQAHEVARNRVCLAGDEAVLEFELQKLELRVEHSYFSIQVELYWWIVVKFPPDLQDPGLGNGVESNISQPVIAVADSN